MDSFSLALRRFVSRQGYVKVTRSNNGTNFVGTYNELKLCIKQLDQIKLLGVWESLVKSVKTKLKTIVKGHIYTDENLQTLFCEVELGMLCYDVLYYVVWNLFNVGSLQFPNDSTLTSLEANQNRPKIKDYVNKSNQILCSLKI